MKTYRNFFLTLKVLCALPFLAVGKAEAAVVLSTNTQAFNVMPGSTFTLTLNLTGNAGEQIAGLDYYWRINNVIGNLVGEISLTNREIGESPFFDVYFLDGVVEASQGNLLDPQNNHDLGALLADVNSPLSNSTWLVATYTFTVSPTATVGEVATLSTINNPGGGWIGPAPAFDGANFDGQASVNVTVIPEPSTYILLGVTLLIMSWPKYRKVLCGKVRFLPIKPE